jgi:tetratricopeptide (TPR) repeat protein
MALVQQGKLEAAIQMFNRGLDSDPANPVLLNAVGATYTLMGDEKKAKGYFLRVLKIEPRFLPARKNLAISYFNCGEYDLAVPEFEQLTQTPGVAPTAYLFLGMIAEKRKQIDKAVALLEKSGELLYQQPLALLVFARSLYELHQSEKGALVLKLLDKIPGVSAADFYQAGLLYSRHGQYSDALQDFEKARNLDSGLGDIDYYRAFVLDELGQPREALNVLRALASRRPDARSLNLLGHVAQEIGDTQLAIQAFYHAAELKPEMEENYLDYSALCMNSENYTLSLDILDAGLAHIPHSYRLLIQKGAVLDKLTRRKEAEEVFRSAMRLQDDNRVAMISLAVAQAHDHRPDEASETLSKAIERYPGDAYMRYFYGSVLFQLAQRQGMKPEMAEHARNELERAIQLNPAYADAYFQLAKTYLDTDPMKAAEQLEACLRRKPDHYPAELQLARLYMKMGKQAEGEQLLRKAARDKQAEKEREDRLPRIEESDPFRNSLTTPQKEERP